MEQTLYLEYDGKRYRIRLVPGDIVRIERQAPRSAMQLFYTSAAHPVVKNGYWDWQVCGDLVQQYELEIDEFVQISPAGRDQ